MTKTVSLKITISSGGEVKAVMWSRIKEGTLHDYSIETGNIELTVEVIEVREK